MQKKEIQEIFKNQTALPVKVKTKKKATKLTPTASAMVLVKGTKNAPAYYQCMSACCQKGQPITKTAQECKQNSPALVAKRTKQIKELQKALGVVSKFAQSLETVIINSH